MTWNESTNAVTYKIYKVEGSATGSVADYKNLKFVTEDDDLSLSFDSNVLATNQYAVSAVDINGFETPAVKSDYDGYNSYLPEGIPPVNPVGSTEGSGGLNTGGTSVPAPTNSSPTAVITMNAPEVIYNDSVITWNHTASTDPNGDAITNAEWKNKQDTYPIGTHTVEMRVQDEKGNWSEWVTKTFEVVNRAPVVSKIISNPATNITTSTNIVWSYEATDPDGDTIVNEEWQGKQSQYTEGLQFISVRVQDSHGTWSEWKSYTFNVLSISEVSGNLTLVNEINEKGYMNYELFTDDTMSTKVKESGCIATQTTSAGKEQVIYTFTGLENKPYYVVLNIKNSSGQVYAPYPIGYKTPQ